MSILPQTLSEFFDIDREVFLEKGIFDGYLSLDSKFHVDPLLLNNCEIPELSDSRQKITKYFNDIFLLLSKSKAKGDIFWEKCIELIVSKENKSTGLGYSKGHKDGSGIGKVYANKMLDVAKEVYDIGVEEPEISSELRLRSSELRLRNSISFKFNCLVYLLSH